MCVRSNSKSQIYVKDLRKVMLFHGKRLKYPKNYDKIVKNGRIITNGFDSEGNAILKLLYGKKNKDGKQLAFLLTRVAEDEYHSKAYYTIYEHIFVHENLHKSFYEPFGFSSIDLEKYAPVFDIKGTGDSDNPYHLVNTLYLAKKGCSVSDESGEVDANTRKEKGLNGKLLYNSTYGKQDPRFFVIRDEADKVEVDKTILCFLICLFVHTIIFIRKLITFLPMKLGECFFRHPVTKILGYIFFTPFVPLKFIIDFCAILIKIPILLFVANEKKYGNRYFVLWKHELIECFHELKSDCAVIKNGERPVAVSDYAEYTLIGTWDELNVRAHHISLDVP